MIAAQAQDQLADVETLRAMVAAMKTTPRHTWVIVDLVELVDMICTRQENIVESCHDLPQVETSINSAEFAAHVKGFVD